jgi:hypothetical protein
MMMKLLFVAILLACTTTTCLATLSLSSAVPTLSTTSPTTITVTGSGFDSITINKVLVAGRDCDEVNQLTDEVFICSAPAGLGQGVLLTLEYTVGVTDHKIAAPIIFYDAAASVTNCGDSTETGDLMISRSSNVFITICGANFGDAADAEDNIDYTGTFQVVVSGGFLATVVSHIDTQIVALLPNHGVGAHLKVSAVFQSQTVQIPNVFVTYPAPTVTGIAIDPNQNKRATTSIKVIITGMYFGDPSPTLILTATIGGFPCVNLNHVSDSIIKCTVIGSGANAAVIITANGVASTSSGGGIGGASVRFDFSDASTPGLNCLPPFGSADVINSDLCNCWSGAAPVDNLLSVDCDVHAVCPGRVTSQTAVAQFAPSRPITSFSNDKLHIKQTAPIVKNRRDTIIQFVVPSLSNSPAQTIAGGSLSSATCNYPGPIWEKRINQLDCLDEYYGVLPWSQNGLCGFLEVVPTTTTRVFKSNLVSTYTETFKKSDGTVHFRKISNSYMLTVSFAKQVTALTTTPVVASIADPDAATSLDVTVDGDALYDVSSKSTIISFGTDIVWPYAIHTATLTGTWTKSAGNSETNTVTATAVLASPQPGEMVCDQVQDTDCEQSWILTIDTQPGTLQQVCNLKGSVEFSTGALDCRDYVTEQACAGSPSANFTINIGATDLCDDGSSADASLGLATTMESFYDAALTIPQAIFQTGDMVYFELIVNDPTSTIDQIFFSNIEIRDSTNTFTDSLYTADPDSGAQLTINPNADVMFNISQTIDEILRAGSDGGLIFQFRLSREHLNVISALSSTGSDSTEQMMVEATITIKYHGNNNKRTVILTNNIPAVAHTTLSLYSMHDEEYAPHANDEIMDNEIFEFSGLFSAASSTTTTCVAAVVAVVVAMVFA